MWRLDRKKLSKHLVSRGMNLSGLAKRSGISRQSIYNMFEGRNIFSTPFEKLMSQLCVDHADLLSGGLTAEVVFSDAPETIRKAAYELQVFAQAAGADLFIFGSRTRGRKGFRHDWDFAVYFPRGVRRAEFALEKQRIEDVAFPHRVDIVCLNDAPGWFLSSIAKEAIRLVGNTPEGKIFSNTKMKDDRRSA